jgi:hypothetical protein
MVKGNEAKTIEEVCDDYWSGKGFPCLKRCVTLQIGTPYLFNVAFRAGFYAMIEKSVLVGYCYEYLRNKGIKTEIAQSFCNELIQRLNEKMSK